MRTVHEQRRDHVCSQCDAAFGEAGHLKTHVRTQHDTKKTWKGKPRKGKSPELKELARASIAAHDTRVFKALESAKADPASVPDGTLAELRLMATVPRFTNGARERFKRQGRVSVLAAVQQLAEEGGVW